MHNLKTRATQVALFATPAVALAGVGFGVDPLPEDIVSSGATGLVTSVLNVANDTWPIWVPILATMIGFRIFKKIAKV